MGAEDPSVSPWYRAGARREAGQTQLKEQGPTPRAFHGRRVPAGREPPEPVSAGDTGHLSGEGAALHDIRSESLRSGRCAQSPSFSSRRAHAWGPVRGEHSLQTSDAPTAFLCLLPGKRGHRLLHPHLSLGPVLTLVTAPGNTQQAHGVPGPGPEEGSVSWVWEIRLWRWACLRAVCGAEDRA